MPKIMGILNVTSDSFSDGGLWTHLYDALEHAQDMIDEGAHIIDVGGESTRPGALRVPIAQEQKKVLPVVRELAKQKIEISVDTMNAQTAQAAVEAGASFINDVSGGLADANMAKVVRDAPRVRYIVMHWRGHSHNMDDLAVYDDVVQQVKVELQKRVDVLCREGVDPSQIILDPGLGFAKKSEHNWQLLAHLDALKELGFPLLIGASRKRFLGELLDEHADFDDRDLPNAILSALVMQQEVWAVRVHEVAPNAIARSIVQRLCEVRNGA